MDKQRLVKIAQALVMEGKGILAADESRGTIKRRFDSINVESTEETLREVFDQLIQQKVLLEGMLLKPSMVISGASAAKRADPKEVAQRTIECLKRTSPAANLNALNLQAAATKAPWELGFSFGRSLQGAPLAAWAGKAENNEAAALEFYTRAKRTSAARKGAA